jgi:hypothetical protein
MWSLETERQKNFKSPPLPALLFPTKEMPKSRDRQRQASIKVRTGWNYGNPKAK